MKITNFNNTTTSTLMRVSPNLARKVRSIKADVVAEFRKVHNVTPKISDTMATKLLGMFLDGDNIVKITHKRKSVNVRLRR